VGFSAGGALALRLAAENHRGLAGVVAVAAPVKWRDKTMGLVSVVHGANVLSGPMSAGRGFKPFHRVQPEHPHINYLHKPVRALYELNQLVGEMESHLGLVRCPVLLLQGSEDPVVEPRSADLIYRGLTSAEKTLIEIPATRHGILYEEIGDTHLKIVEFLDRLEETP
jgi:esterase/lipase